MLAAFIGLGVVAVVVIVSTAIDEVVLTRRHKRLVVELPERIAAWGRGDR